MIAVTIIVAAICTGEAHRACLGWVGKLGCMRHTVTAARIPTAEGALAGEGTAVTAVVAVTSAGAIVVAAAIAVVIAIVCAPNARHNLDVARVVGFVGRLARMRARVRVGELPACCCWLLRHVEAQADCETQHHNRQPEWPSVKGCITLSQRQQKPLPQVPALASGNVLWGVCNPSL